MVIPQSSPGTTTPPHSYAVPVLTLCFSTWSGIVEENFVDRLFRNVQRWIRLDTTNDPHAMLVIGDIVHNDGKAGKMMDGLFQLCAESLGLNVTELIYIYVMSQ